MAHLTSRSGYHDLVTRINKMPEGAPPDDLLYQILRTLFSEQDAAMLAQLPMRPFSAARAAKIWRISSAEARTRLERFADRGLMLDMPDPKDGQIFLLPPPMAGFFEFSLMRIRPELDQGALAELFYQYLNVEDDFVKAMFAEETHLGRAFVQEPALPAELSLHVLDYERASQVIENASHIAIGLCYCRHKMEHVGQACDAPQDICMSFNNAAASLIKHKIARAVDKSECHELLHQAYEANLVQFGENVRESVNFICNCCGCCCEALLGARRFAFLHPVHTSNFIPHILNERCSGCGKCVDICPVEALSLVSANRASMPRARWAKLQEELCLGCGVCTRACPSNALHLTARAKRVITPLNSAHRIVKMAVERGTLQNLIFDNHALTSHRVMSAILGALLRLPPIKRTLASDQIQSRYFEALIRKLGV
ncbi:4Fe-4S binding protein [Azotosporobacter soli]|uniref:4Fe-4S binding protein n=1 Tax=Azotosporobacter soli TaxID=3055040 RepID=UPI0031FE9F2B